MFKTNANTGKEKYPSSKFLLNVLQKEYDYDLNALNTLYTRVGIIFAFTGIYMNTLLKNPINLNMKLKVTKIKDIIIPSITVVTYIGCLIFMIISMYFLFSVLLTNSYKRIRIDQGFDRETSLKQENEICYFFMERFKEVTEANKEILNKKSKKYEKTIKSLIISLILYAIYIFIIYV